MLYVIIRNSAVPEGLRALAASDEACSVMSFNASDQSEAASLLAEVDTEEWSSSPDYTEANGESSTDIRLPKKAITG
jgi:hypothetical protein